MFIHNIVYYFRNLFYVHGVISILFSLNLIKSTLIK